MYYQNSPKEYFFLNLLYIVHQSELTELKPHLYKTSFHSSFLTSNECSLLSSGL